uniref:Uncharacterized protein n=1 Tax=Daphnia galeata TaxID=27404 RepID=A0A8J2W972_9CRUS|nr:unnamed protein product [Daphnia galeata]
MDISNNTMGRLHTEASSSTVDFSSQQVFQPGNTICRLGNTDASASNMDLSTQKTIHPGTFFIKVVMKISMEYIIHWSHIIGLILKLSSFLSMDHHI